MPEITRTSEEPARTSEAGPAAPSAIEAAGALSVASGETALAAATRPPPARDWSARLWPVFLIVVGGTIWGMTFSLARIATLAGAHPIGLTLWQGLFGGLFLLSLALWRRRPPRLDRPHLIFYVACGLLGTVVPGTLYFYAAPKVPAGVLAITIATVPIMTFAGALLLRMEGAAWGRLLGLVCGLAAVLLIVLPESSLPDPAMAAWVLIAILAAVCYTAENIYVAVRRPAGSDALAVVSGMLLVASLIMAPIVAVSDTFVPLGLPFGEVEWAVIGMMAINALAYALFYHVVQISGPVFAAQMAYVVTLSGVFWGIVIFGEQHSLWIWGSIALMLIGLALVTPRPAQRPAAR